jgi:hypothetical protein
MPELTVHIEVPKGEDPEELARQIQSRLLELGEEVDKADAKPEELRSGVEVASLIVATISIISNTTQIVKGSGQLAEALHDALPKIKQVLQDLGLKKVSAEVGMKRVALSDVTDSDVRKIAAAGSGS